MTSRPWRVLVVHNRYRSVQPSGEDRVVDQETALLAGAGHHVSTFERRSDDIDTMSPARRLMVPLQVPWNPAVRAELTDRLRVDRPDVVHVHNTFPLLSPAVVAACTDVGVPVVATLHNYLMVCPRGTLFRDGRFCDDCAGSVPLPAVRHGCYRNSRVATVPLVVNHVVNRTRWETGVSVFFCPSEAHRSTLVRAGMPAERMVVKPNHVPDAGVRRAGPGSHILYLGRLAEEKGVRLLMAAWDRVAQEGGLGVPLVVAGSGPLDGAVREWAAGRDDVDVRGLQSRSASAGLMADAVAVVAPSTWTETFGLVAVEAMAAGVPAVVAAHGGLADLVEDGVTGVHHRPFDVDSLADALRRVVPADRNRAMGTAARRRYERDFTPDRALNALLDGYRAAVRRAHPHPAGTSPSEVPPNSPGSVAPRGGGNR
jgi:glycosyltransferase involved in cell wall biosynthesis